MKITVEERPREVQYLGGCPRQLDRNNSTVVSMYIDDS